MHPNSNPTRRRRGRKRKVRTGSKETLEDYLARGGRITMILPMEGVEDPRGGFAKARFKTLVNGIGHTPSKPTG